MNDLMFFVKVGLVTFMLGAGLCYITNVIPGLVFLAIIALTYLALIGLNKNHNTLL